MEIDWNVIVGIGTIVSPIVTLIVYFCSKKDDIRKNKIINDQLKFEEYVVSLLREYNNIYNNLLTPYLVFNENNKNVTNESIFAISSQCTIATTYITNVNSEILFHYKYYDFKHPQLDNFIKDINLFNSGLSTQIINYQNLLIEAQKANSLLLSDAVSKIEHIVDKRGVIVTEIACLYNRYKSILYDEADKVIKERANIIKNGRIYEKERKKRIF